MFAWPKLILLAGAAAIGITMILATVTYVKEAEQAKTERDAMELRLRHIETTRSLEDEIRNLDPDAHWLELCERLSAC